MAGTVFSKALEQVARLGGLSSFVLSLLDDTSASAAQTTLGLVIDTDVQGYGALNLWGRAGQYTGDGATSQQITGLGIDVIAVWVNNRETADAAAAAIDYATELMVDNNAAGLSLRHLNGGGHSFQTNRIIAMGDGFFTVDDNGADQAPNANSTLYEYLAIGYIT